MKALSLTQPWAMLVAIGEKQIETRSWNTSYRGIIAIHASKSFPKAARDLCYRTPFNSSLKSEGYEGYSNLPLGMVIAIARLQRIMDTDDIVAKISQKEKAFGDYSSGRYAWYFTDVFMLPMPIPAKGMLNLWEWNPDQQLNQLIADLAKKRQDK